MILFQTAQTLWPGLKPWHLKLSLDSEAWEWIC